MVGYLSIEHVRALWRARFSAYFWDTNLRLLCRSRSDFANEVASIADRAEGVERIALLFCLDCDLSVIREELERLDLQSDAELARQPFGIFTLAELDWTGMGSLYLRLFARGDEQLISSLLGTGCPCEIKGLGPFGAEDLIPIVNMAVGLRKGPEYPWLSDQLGSIIARYGDNDVRRYLLDQLSRGEPAVRHWVKVWVLKHIHNISTDDMSEDAIAFLLADLSRPDAVSIWNNPLGHVATERFVVERLIPLARGASETIQKNLRIVLSTVGNRHARRYLLPS